MITIKNNNSRANAVKVIFYLMMAVDIISAYSNILQHQLLKAASDGIPFTAADAEVNDARQQLIAGIQLLLIIGTIISFIMWFHRAYKNLHELKISTLNYTPGWAIGSWFVPFLNLARPYTIMREIWEDTQAYVFQKGNGERISSIAIIGWWWGFWIVNNLVGNASARSSIGATTVDDLLFSTNINILSDVVDMIAMILTLTMITKMMNYETKLWDFVNETNDLKKEDDLMNSTPLMDIAGI